MGGVVKNPNFGWKFINHCFFYDIFNQCSKLLIVHFFPGTCWQIHIPSPKSMGWLGSQVWEVPNKTVFKAFPYVTPCIILWQPWSSINQSKTKLARLRRCASMSCRPACPTPCWSLFSSSSFVGHHADHHVGHLVFLHVGHPAHLHSYVSLENAQFWPQFWNISGRWSQWCK